jgi:hypothetical protein
MNCALLLLSSGATNRWRLKMSLATEMAKKAAEENKARTVNADPVQYNLQVAIYAIAEALEGIEARLARLEMKL